MELHHQLPSIQKQGVTVLVITPDPPGRIQSYWETHQFTFWAIPDPRGTLLNRLGQETSWWKLGRMPGLILLNALGTEVYTHHGRTMRDLPDFRQALAALPD